MTTTLSTRRGNIGAATTWLLLLGIGLAVAGPGCSSPSNQPPPSSERALTAFGFSSPAAQGNIDEKGKTIDVTVPFGTDLRALVATFTTTGVSVTVKDVAQASGTTANDFSGPVSYLVGAADGSTATYVVLVRVAPASAKALSAFFITNPLASGAIDEGAKTVAVTVPYGTDVSSLVATFTTTGQSVHVGSSAQVSGVTANDFSSPVGYVVTAADGSTATYSVTVTVAAPEGKAVTAFVITAPAATGVIDQAARTISVTVPYGTPVTALVAGFTIIGDRVTVGTTTQVSGVTANDFTQPVAYVVHAADGSTLTYTASVNVPTTTDKALTAFSFPSVGTTGVIDEPAKTISLLLPYGTARTNLVATFATTGTRVEVGTVQQTSGNTPNDFSAPVQYRVTAANGSTATYTVTAAVRQGTTDLPRTGRTPLSPPVVGDDGTDPVGVDWPSPRFESGDGGTVVDRLTGLEWGPSANVMPTRDPGWDTDNITDDGSVTWQHALDYVRRLNQTSYLGRSDWRLPNRNELLSLTDYSHGWTTGPTLPAGHPFTDVAIVGYWTSTTAADNHNAAMQLCVSTALWVARDAFTYSFKGSTGSVWPVRGTPRGVIDLPQTGQRWCYDTAGTQIPCTDTGQDGELQFGAPWPNPRFADNGDGTITDHLTGLMWLAETNCIGTSYPGYDNAGAAGAVGWPSGVAFLASLNQGSYPLCGGDSYQDWRLPNANELLSLSGGDQAGGTWLRSLGFRVPVGDWKYHSSTLDTANASRTFQVTTVNSFSATYSSANGLVWPVRGPF